MRSPEWVAEVVTMAWLATVAASCGSLPPTTYEMTPGHELKGDEALVLGRLLHIGFFGDTTDFGVPRDVNMIFVRYTSIYAAHLMTPDSGGFRVLLRDDGTFLWHMKPGVYSIAGMTHYGGPTHIIQNWGGRGVFSVIPGDRAIYIGTLVVNESGNDPAGRYHVEDDYDDALTTVAARNPGATLHPTPRLMAVQ